MTIAPRPAEALFGIGDVVIDPSNLIQNSITAASSAKNLIKPVFWALAKITLEAVVHSTIDWINTGFHGSPLYATNITRNLQMAADTYAQSYLNQITNDAAIQSPFMDKIIQAAGAAYYLKSSKDAFASQLVYDLQKYSTNDRAFLAGDFRQGGWDAWMAAVTNPANNAFGAQFVVGQQLAAQAEGGAGETLTELNWGNGFFSFKGNCTVAKSSSGQVKAVNVQVAGSETQKTSLSNTDTCITQNIKTPGSAVAAAEQKVQGAGIDELISARDFNEIVSALMAQLILHAVGGGGGGGGLAGLTPSAGGSGYFDGTSVNQGSINTSLSSSFLDTLQGQRTQLQAYQQEWAKIGSAAQSAKSALTSSTCVSNAQSIIASQVDPVIAQAKTEAGRVTTSLAALDKIQNELPTTNDSSGGAATQAAQAMTDFQNYLAAATTPSVSDFSDAATQSSDSQGSSNPTLYTQMTQLAQQGSCTQSV